MYTGLEVLCRNSRLSRKRSLEPPFLMFLLQSCILASMLLMNSGIIIEAVLILMSEIMIGFIACCMEAQCELQDDDDNVDVFTSLACATVAG